MFTATRARASRSDLLSRSTLTIRGGVISAQAFSTASASQSKRSLCNSSRRNGINSQTMGTQLRTMASATAQSDLLKYGQYVNKGLGRSLDGILTKGEGSWITMDDGRRLLDFSCGIGVTNLGHCHPKISGAAAEQCMKVVHSQCSIAFHEPYLELIKKILPFMPHPSLDSFFFWNSGSEVIEGAIKIARVTTGRQNIIAMQGGYHGRTYGAMAVTKSKTIYSEGVHPLMPGVYTLPFPYWHQMNLPSSTDPAELSRLCLAQLDLLLSQQTAPRDTAAILLEPVLGEGGYVPAPPEFLRGLREVCDREGILLIADEIQCGYGRTGRMFAVEESGVRPDIMTIAKGLANGFPLSGIITRREYTDKLKPGSMGGTYAGNAVACAAACAVADVFKNENILDNVNARSVELFSALNALHNDPAISKYILDVRGKGLMVAVEFASPVGTGLYDSFVDKTAPRDLAKRIAARCQKKGLFILTTSVYEVIRFIPALNITKEEMAEGCRIFKEAVEEVVHEG